jgi:hypothetical protein
VKCRRHGISRIRVFHHHRYDVGTRIQMRESIVRWYVWLSRYLGGRHWYPGLLLRRSHLWNLDSHGYPSAMEKIPTEKQKPLVLNNSKQRWSLLGLWVSLFETEQTNECFNSTECGSREKRYLQCHRLITNPNYDRAE